MGEVELAKIRATSPTLAEVMRSCLLRAGLSRAVGASALALGNPRAWLGTAYHEVLEKIPEVDLRAQSLEHALDRHAKVLTGRVVSQALPSHVVLVALSLL